MNEADWRGSEVCGMCARVEGPRGEVTVRVVDLCPGCGRGDLDLSEEAFSRIARPSAGRVPIRWTEVPCPVSGPLRYHFKDGSNPHWTAIQLRNHRHRAVALEAFEDARWRPLSRKGYNYFVASDGLGEGPLTLRATDVHGDVVVDRGVPELDDDDVSSSGQFKDCR